MDTFTSILGWMTLAALAIGLCAVLIGAAAYLCHRVMHWMYCKAYDRAVADIARHINGSSHWFSEDYNTSKCLEILARRMALDMGSYAAPEKWRQQWRDACVKFKDTGIDTPA